MPPGVEGHYGLAGTFLALGFVRQVRQGELADPLYFDFIAFAQYATICAAFPEAPQVFQARMHSISHRGL
jgi:hypothetical protein